MNDQAIDAAIALLKSAGYRVTKPKAPRAKRPALNAIGRPFSPSYDPNYKIKHRVPSIARLCTPMVGFPWVQHP